jgi:hypothetical protein
MASGTTKRKVAGTSGEELNIGNGELVDDIIASYLWASVLHTS